MNPIFLREIRQAVRSRVLAFAFGAELLALLGFLYHRFLFEYHGLPPEHYGEALFNVLFRVVALGTLGITLAHTILRCIVDRANEDPMFTTTLTPGRIVRGRIIASLFLSGAAYTLALPFFTFAYLLRGIDLGQLLHLCLLGFWWTQVLNLIAIAFFIGVRGWLDALVSALPYLLVSAILALAAYTMWWFWGQSGPDALWYVSLAALLPCGVLTPAVAYWYALAACMGDNEDRMFRLRRGLTILLPLLLLAGFAFALFPGIDPNIYFVISLYTVSVISIVLFPILVSNIMTEPDGYSERLRRSLPKNFLLRLLRFPLTSGVVNGFAWYLGIALFWLAGWLVCLALSFYFIASGNGATNVTEDMVEFLTFILFMFVPYPLYVFCYAATGRLIWEGLLKRRLPLRYAWTITAALVLVFGLASLLWQYAFEGGVAYSDTWEWRTALAVYPFPPLFRGGEFAYNIAQLWCSAIWTLVLLLPGSVLFFKRFRQFRRLEENRVPPEPAA